MKPNKIFLVRHAQSVGNVDKSVYLRIPDYAIPLTPEGKEQAVETGRRLREQVGAGKMYCYISPFRRTKESFIQIAKSFKKEQIAFREDVRLREQEWTNRFLASFDFDQEADRDRYSVFYYRFNGGESNADVHDRTSSFLDTLHRDFEKEDFPENCLIVGHGMQLRVFLMRFFHYTVEELELLRNPRNAQIITLQREGNRFFLTEKLEKHPSHTHDFHFNLSEELGKIWKVPNE